MYLFKSKVVILCVEKGVNMFAIVISIVLFAFLALAGASLFVSNISPEELNNMGVEIKS